jgi:hypothetical protein
MDNDQRRTYRPQLLVFQKLRRRFDPLVSNYYIGRGESPVSIESYEPDLQKQKITNYSSSLDSLYHHSNNVAVKEAMTNSSSQRKETFTPLKMKRKSKNKLPKPNTQLKSKKQVVEIIDAILGASPLTYEDDAKQKYRFFGYDKESQYQKGPSGFQIIQTHDQKGYYATLNLKKR